MIRLENIEVTFGDFTAIPQLNLEVRRGEFFTLLGPSGCGKTTALRTLAGFIDPAAGEVFAQRLRFQQHEIRAQHGALGEATTPRGQSCEREVCCTATSPSRTSRAIVW